MPKRRDPLEALSGAESIGPPDPYGLDAALQTFDPSALTGLIAPGKVLLGANKIPARDVLKEIKAIIQGIGKPRQTMGVEDVVNRYPPPPNKPVISPLEHWGWGGKSSIAAPRDPAIKAARDAYNAQNPKTAKLKRPLEVTKHQEAFRAETNKAVKPDPKKRTSMGQGYGSGRKPNVSIATIEQVQASAQKWIGKGLNRKEVVSELKPAFKDQISPTRLEEIVRGLFDEIK